MTLVPIKTGQNMWHFLSLRSFNTAPECKTFYDVYEILLFKAVIDGFPNSNQHLNESSWRGLTDVIVKLDAIIKIDNGKIRGICIKEGYRAISDGKSLVSSLNDLEVLPMNAV